MLGVAAATVGAFVLVFGDVPEEAVVERPEAVPGGRVASEPPRPGWRVTARASGTVRDAMGRPVAGADVRLGEQRTRTDGQGEFILYGEPSGAREVQVSGPGFRGVTLPMSSARGALDLRLERDPRPLVRLAAASRQESWRGAHIYLQGSRMWTARKHHLSAGRGGTWSVRGLPPRRSSYRVTFPAQRIGDRLYARTVGSVVIGSTDERSRELVLDPEPGALVAGRVLDPEGRPVVGAHVRSWVNQTATSKGRGGRGVQVAYYNWSADRSRHWRGTVSSPYGEARTNNEGRFVFRGCAKVPYTIRYHTQERVRNGRDTWLGVTGGDQDVEVRPRGATTASAAPTR